jgi:hypothetical protein
MPICAVQAYPRNGNSFMTKIFVYQAPENHLEKRAGLSPLLAAKLFDPPPGGRAAYRGEASVWMQVHEGLLGASATLPRWSEDLLARDRVEEVDRLAPRILALGRQLVQHAHGHHHIEDDFFFPTFLRAFPELESPIDLLEGDHEILAVVLDDLEKAVMDFGRSLGTEQKSKRDAVLKAGEVLTDRAWSLDRLFTRHIGDEEEICLPVLYRI